MRTVTTLDGFIAIVNRTQLDGNPTLVTSPFGRGLSRGRGGKVLNVLRGRAIRTEVK